MLGLLPMPTLESFPILYLDLAAVRASGTADWRTDRGIATLPDILRTPIGTDLQAPGGFAAHAGFGPDQIDQVAVTETAPGPGPTALRLRDADPAALARTWIQQGYARSDVGDAKVWTRGTPEMLQLDRVDPSDPLSTQLGVSAVLSFDGPTLLMARLPATLATMKASAKLGTGAASRIDLRRMLDALDRTLGPREAVAQLLWVPQPDAAGDAGFEAATSALTAPGGATPGAAKDALTGASGIPSYPSLLLGDIRTTGQAPSGVLAMLFADCAIADRAGAVAAAKWEAAAKDANSKAAGVFGRITVAWASVSVDGGCVLLGRASGRDPARPAFADLTALYMRRDLSPLYVGAPPKP
ncbi:hypothetical protein E9232_002401 [Inquilinus ginsengisoli]|uniref:Uncharacterized protein n=1 Tax=Inquilinus ginsengisoli TaxID=363840 RepID=A0ABU1JMQ0_9PROT|nr:hypothetical protein [Inquilinus ginsengisoli]MDR6289880.1 hypothetical protein [Inquilinus ginsengisoli]